MPRNPIRARDLGIPFSGTPGPLNAISDVVGVEVGHATLVSGEGRLEVGKGPVRTGVTAVLPRGRGDARPTFGGSFALNAAGEMTGLVWLDERGLFEGPVMITNTHSVGAVRDATIQWMLRHGWEFDWTAPIVGETYDGMFNDINGGHVRAEHVWQALDSARGGAVEEGNVGGGTGMKAYEFKGGIGTSSRQLAAAEGGYRVGVLVQANYGRRSQLRIAGIPVGRSLTADMPHYTDGAIRPENARYPALVSLGVPTDGSIVVVVATDAPLMPHQLKRLAKRPALGIGRLGGVGANGSGDIFIAFSTANAGVGEAAGTDAEPCAILPNALLTPLFEATIDASEEAIVNAMVAAETSTGANGLRLSRLPHDKVKRLLDTHGLLVGGKTI
ncbi:MAG TPA: P1 family peptidase [Bradyrhizobium sp.]|nr:P1 family peptidase [Bradyrhizobium sp.]